MRFDAKLIPKHTLLPGLLKLYSSYRLKADKKTPFKITNLKRRKWTQLGISYPKIAES